MNPSPGGALLDADHPHNGVLFPRRITPRSCDQRRIAIEVSSVPLSLTMQRGRPRIAIAASSSRATRAPEVIPPFLPGLLHRIHAGRFSFCAGVMPPIPILGGSLLYVQSHCVA